MDLGKTTTLAITHFRGKSMKAKLFKIKTFVRNNLLLVIGVAMLLTTTAVYAINKDNQTATSNNDMQTIDSSKTAQDKPAVTTKDDEPKDKPNEVTTSNANDDSTVSNQAEIDATQARIDKLAEEHAQNTLCLNLNKKHYADYQYARDVTIQNEYEDTLAAIQADYDNGTISLAHSSNLSNEALKNKRAKVTAARGKYDKIMKSGGCDDFVQ